MKHQNIVQLYGIEEDSAEKFGNLSIVIEYCELGSLFDLIHNMGREKVESLLLKYDVKDKSNPSCLLPSSIILKIGLDLAKAIQCLPLNI